MGNYETWYELVGTDYYTSNQINVDSVPCNPLDNMFVSIKARYYDSPKYVYFDFYISNTTESESTSFTSAVTKCNGTDESSEWICERPNINGSTSSYASSETVYGNYVPFGKGEYREEDSTNWSILNNSKYYNSVDMTNDSGNVLAHTSSLSSEGSFNVYLKGYN